MNIEELDIFQLNELKNIIKDMRASYIDKVRDIEMHNPEFIHLTLEKQESLENFRDYTNKLLLIDEIITKKIKYDFVYE